MGTTADKLQYLIDAKSSISAAIEAKGGTVPQELSGYGPAIEALPSGGSSDLAKKIVDRSVTEVTAADLSGATAIGDYALYNCPLLTSIAIPDSVTSIGVWAFSRCSGLKSITIPNSVTSIGQSTFRDCTGLTSATIGSGVTGTSTEMFYNCSGLTSITIPANVLNIAGMTFNKCSNCLVFDFSNHTSIPTLANVYAFTSTPANKKIIVPDALYETWKTTNNWNSSTNGIVDAITKASEA